MTIAAILTIASLAFNHANHPQIDSKNMDKPEDPEKVYLETVVDRENAKVVLRRDSLGSWSIIYTIDKNEQILDLDSEDIPQKELELVWANEDYACIMTWWSQAQSRHVFIPLKKEYQFIYLDKDIKATDSINNNIVYVDTLYESGDKIVFAAENLFSRKIAKARPVTISRANSVYPFYYNIAMTRKKVVIRTGSGKRTIDISGLY